MPPVVESATVAPPTARLVPKTSSRRTVIVEVKVPSAVMKPGLTQIVEVVADAAPAPTATGSSR